MKLYPLQFEPILKRIWVAKTKNLLNKITSNITGESWELSTVEDECVANGEWKGKSLTAINVP
jgi:mannose-6-phosphate isomerase